MISMESAVVDQFNAFGVNSIGLERRPFPLSISRVAVDDVWVVDATAARAYELIDILAADADRAALVLNVDQTSWLDDNYQPWPLRRIAQQQHVPAAACDIRWASPDPAVDNDLLVMSWSDLPRLLDGWSPYNIDLFDQPRPPDTIDDLVLTVSTRRIDDYLLARLPGSTVYYSGHDDCYIHIQTTDPTLPSRLFARLLATLAGSALLDARTESVVVPHPDPHLTADLLRQGNHWIGIVVDSRPGSTVTIGLTPRDRPWRLGDHIHTAPSYLITLGLQNGAWRVTTE
jgi:hypothetical protein